MSHNHQYSASHPDCGHRSHYHKPCSYLWCPLLRTECPLTLVVVFDWWEVITRVQSSLQTILCVCGDTEMPLQRVMGTQPCVSQYLLVQQYLYRPVLWSPGAQHLLMWSCLWDLQPAHILCLSHSQWQWQPALPCPWRSTALPGAAWGKLFLSPTSPGWQGCECTSLGLLQNSQLSGCMNLLEL